MRFKHLCIAGFIVFVISNPIKASAQAPTFGPICDGVTVTCIPTEAPTAVPTDVPYIPPPTDVPLPPPELPVAGSGSRALTLLGIGGVLLLMGILGKTSSSPVRD